MSTTALTLGPISFQGFEVPPKINFGGRQLLAVHQMTNGRRVVDTLGPSESDISFSGTFSGSDAAVRARALDFLRRVGSQVVLTWDAFCYTVVINTFDADYNTPSWVPYKIGCTVVRNETTSSPSAQTSIVSAAEGDLSSAAGFCADLNVDLSPALLSLQQPNATMRDTSEYGAAQAAIFNVGASLGSCANAAQSVLLQDINQCPATDMPTAIARLTSAAQQLAEATTASGYVNRAATTMANAST